MADSLGTNPIIVDLSDANDRIIKTGRVKVKRIIVSGDIAIGPPQFAITERLSTGVKQFQFWNDDIGAAVYNDSYAIDATLKDPLFNNISNRAWSSDSIMAIYLE